MEEGGFLVRWPQKLMKIFRAQAGVRTFGAETLLSTVCTVRILFPQVIFDPGKLQGVRMRERNKTVGISRSASR